MNLSIVGVLFLLLCVQSRSVRNERWNTLDQSENRDLFLSALQAYFSRRGIHVDRTAPSFIILSTKLRNIRDSEPSDDDFLESELKAHGLNKDFEWEKLF